MGILTMSGDSLKYDRLKEDALKGEYDPVGKAEGKRVKTYYDDYGFAMHPEERTAAEGFKNKVDEVAAQQQGAINQYQSAYSGAKSEADAKAAGILADAQAKAGSIKKQSVPTVPIRVVDASGKKIEATYNVPREVAEKLAAEKELVSSWVDGGKNFNVSVKTRSGRYLGQELHTMIQGVTNQVNEANKIYDSYYDTAKEVAGSQIDSLKQDIASQQWIAQAGYDQNVSQANAVLSTIKGKWTTFLSDQRAAFTAGIQTNNGGIKDLVQSGALAMKGSRK